MNETDHEYLGEVKERKPWQLVCLAFLLGPGAAWLYVGHLWRGVFVNLAMILGLQGFMITLALLRFFPALPALVLVSGWIVLTLLTARSAALTIQNPYILKPVNHPVAYLLCSLLTFLGPVFTTLEFTSRSLMGLQTIDHVAHIPVLEPGDMVLVDRTAFRRAAPARGDLIALRPQAQRPNVLRVVASAQDNLRMDDDQLIINDEPLRQIPFEASEIPTGMRAKIEENNTARYLVTQPETGFIAQTVPAFTLDAISVYALADNRHQLPLNHMLPRDSRNFGPIKRDEITGKPLYIIWSTHPESRQIRWERIGLKIE